MASPPATAIESGATPSSADGLSVVTDLALPGVRVYLRLRFWDPEHVARDMPEGLQVRVAGQTFNLRAEGRLSFVARILSPPGSFSLEFPATNLRFVVCEPAPNGSPPGSPPAGTSPPSYPRLANAAPNTQERFFALPIDYGSPPGMPWATTNSLWSMATSPPGNATYSNGVITHTNRSRSIGSGTQPAVLILDPRWRHFRFEFFDRYYGPAPRSGGGAGHGARITIPQIGLEGFYESTDPADGAVANTHSNWTVSAGGQNRTQCLPWILRKKRDGTEFKIEGQRIGLRFKLPDRSYIHSTSGTARAIEVINPDPLPGPRRLQYYRLPALWKSKGYYTRGVTGSPPNAKFFGELGPEDINKADGAGSALRFSLDDIVLAAFNPAGALAPVQLGDQDRVILFHHRFSGANNGIYAASTANIDERGYPYSNVTLHPASRYDPAVSPPTARYYIHDYPDWTRLVVTQGNLFDALDQRTPGTCPVVGARAAVRWVQATQAPFGTSPGSPPIATGILTPRPGIVLQPSNDDKATFALQTFHQQTFLIDYGGGNPQAAPIAHNEWTTGYGAETCETGRYDIALLRCADWDGNNEVSVLLRYIRMRFDFETVDRKGSPPNQNPFRTGASPPAPCTREQWAKDCIDNISNRWNGRDAQNNAPAWILPRRLSPPGPPLRVQVVNLFQFIKKDWAHYNLITIIPTSQSAVNGFTGTGWLRANCNIHDGGPTANFDMWNRGLVGRGLATAHEMGHSGGHMDDYINTADFTDIDNPIAPSPNYAHLGVLGAPYVLEDEDFVNGTTPTGKGLMMQNWYIRARYFWPSAEWLRLLPALRNVDFKVSRIASAAPPSGEENYFLLHYPRDTTAGTHRNRTFVAWPVSFGIRRTGGNNSLFDSVLYMLGEDKYSTVVLRNKILPAPPAGRIDGILVVMLRVRVNFSNMPAGAPANANFQKRTRNTLFDEVIKAVESRLNFRHLANFQVCVGPGGPTFTNCLIHFMPCLATAGTVNSNTSGPTVAASVPHLEVAIDPLASPPVWNLATSPPLAKVLRLPVSANFNTLALVDRRAEILNLAEKISEKCLAVLGLSDASPPDPRSRFTGQAYKGIVRTVMDGGAPDFNVT